MRYLPDGTWMQKADAHTIREIGIPSVVLMEHAAWSTLEAMEREEIDCSRVLVACGGAARVAAGAAVPVDAAIVGIVDT